KVMEVTSEFVGKSNILSSLNLSKEGVKIQGDKIDLQGLVTVLNADGSAGTMINGNKLITGSIVANRLNVNEIFGNSAVISKIQSDSVKTATLDAGKITTGTLNANRIGAQSITTAKLNAGAVTAEKIAANAITANKIAANAVTAGKINVDELSAITADLGSITAGNITGVNVSGSKFTLNRTLTGDGDYGIEGEYKYKDTRFNIADVEYDGLFRINSALIEFRSKTIYQKSTPAERTEFQLADVSPGQLSIRKFRTSTNGTATGAMRGNIVKTELYSEGVEIYRGGTSD